MLIRFEVENFRSVLEPVELSMVAVDTDRPETREIPNLGESLLHIAAILGPNASGKSNIVEAVAWLRDAVQSSLRSWDDSIPVEPFAFAQQPTRTTGFVIESVIDGVRFEYALELDRTAVAYEALFHYPEKKRRRLFEREGHDLKLQRGLGHLSGTRSLLTERTLVLSAARRFGDPLVSGFARELLNIQSLGLSYRTRRRLPLRQIQQSTTRLFEPDLDTDQPTLFDPDDVAEPSESSSAERIQALALLRLADLGIEDVALIKDPEISTDAGQRRTGRERLRLMHRTAHGPVALTLDEESEGTRTWFRLIGPVLFALRAGSLLLFDELDASLHPTLSAQLIRLFQDPATNPHDAQLIFTTHDTSLLNHLNRDEVWLTEKSDAGSTRLGALAEFAGERVRTSVNLEKAYLHGRFGALPETDRTDLLRALGLIG
ncbi:ATP-binding protein [Kribbella yunnanensis]|uniref:ATP-binding protein n=1 Tax=Kribbella yunnanensis TaxID=190194 RepID=A0ABN2I7K1_9ACTN